MPPLHVYRMVISGSLVGLMTCSTVLVTSCPQHRYSQDINSSSSLPPQVESVLVEHKDVAEAAVVPIPHTVKGEALYCFITLNEGAVFGDSVQAELKTLIRTKIAPFAMPDYIQSAPGLPKTRSGKIMRRVLKKIANNERDLGDISTMADSSVVEVLFTKREEMMQNKKNK